MYNDLPQQTPQYYYGGAPQVQMPQYPRFVPQEASQRPLIPAVAQNYIKGRPVVSIDEAKAAQIDLDGSLYVFPDLGSKKIYTKQINLDGTATFNVFELAEMPVEEPISYVTKDELAVILDQFRASLAASTTPAPSRNTQPAPKINL